MAHVHDSHWLNAEYDDIAILGDDIRGVYWGYGVGRYAVGGWWVDK